MATLAAAPESEVNGDGVNNASVSSMRKTTQAVPPPVRRSMLRRHDGS